MRRDRGVRKNRGTKGKSTQSYQMHIKLVGPVPKYRSIIISVFYNFYYLCKGKLVNLYCTHNQLTAWHRRAQVRAAAWLPRQLASALPPARQASCSRISGSISSSARTLACILEVEEVVLEEADEGEACILAYPPNTVKELIG